MRLPIKIGLFILLCLHAGATIIPAGLKTDWHANAPGVVGGIPAVTTIYATMTTNNTAADINTALANCPSNQVVFLLPGLFIINQQLLIGNSGGVQHNGVVLRGSGPGSAGINCTYLVFTNCGSDYAVVNFLPVNSGSGPLTANVVNWTAGYTQGTTTITVSSVPGNLTIGTILSLDQQNADSQADLNGTVNPIGCESIQTGFCRGGSDPTNSTYLIRNQVQTVRVTGISGNNLTISPGLYMTNWSSSLNPQASWSANPLLTCGIENMVLDDGYSYGTGNPNTLLFDNCYNCWAKNIETFHSCYSCINTLWTSHLEIRDSYFHDCASGGASVSYGVNTSYGTSDALIENNIFNAISSPILIDQGASGNVFGYNYMTNMIYPGINMAGCETTHGAHPSMNLFEGNCGNQIEHDFIHGSSSHSTHFRERMTGTEPGKLSYTYPVSLQGTNWFDNFVGCVLGTTGYHSRYQYTITNTPDTYPPTAVYWLGVNCIGGDPSVGNLLAVTNQLRTCNWDSSTLTNGGVVWDPNIADHTVPTSLYLTSRPSWFGSVPFPPIGPDVAGLVNNLPAYVRLNGSPIPTIPPGGFYIQQH